MRKALVLILVCVSAFCFSQENKKNALFTIRGNIGIPRPVSSQMFRTCFSAIYEGNLSANLRLFSNFYAGVGYQNTFFQNAKFLKQTYFNTSIPYNTSLMANGVFIKLGYDKFYYEKMYVSFSLNSGIILARYADVLADTNVANQPYGPLKFNAPYVQPEISWNFVAEKKISFSLLFSYTTLFWDFDPKAPRFNHIGEISKLSNRYVMSWINIGFGVHVLLGK